MHVVALRYCTFMTKEITPNPNLVALHTQEIAALWRDSGKVQRDITEMKADIAFIKADLVEIKADLVIIKQDIVEIKADIVEIKSTLNILMDLMMKIDGELVAMNKFMAETRKKDEEQDHEIAQIKQVLKLT